MRLSDFLSEILLNVPKISQIRDIEFVYFKRNKPMIRSTEELYERFYATALQTIADARDLDKFDFDGQRELAHKTAEMCVAIVKELQNVTV